MIDILFALALLSLALVWGLALLPELKSCALSCGERLWLASGLGYGTLSLLTFGAGLAGGLNKAVLLAIALPVTLAAGLWVKRRRLVPIQPEPFPRSFLGIIGLVPILFNFLAALTPEVRADPVTYHLSLAFLHATSGRIAGLPWHAFSYFPANEEMLYTLALVFARDTAAKLVHFTHGLLVVAGIALIARRFFGARQAPLAALLVLLIPWTGYLSSTCYIELGLAWHEILCLFYVLLALDKDSRTAWTLAGIEAGFALGTKYAALPLFLIPLGLAILILALRRRSGRIMFHCILALIVSLIVFSPWVLRNILLTGNPLFPLLIRWLGPHNPWTASLDQWMREVISPPEAIYQSLPALFQWVLLRIRYLAHNGGSYPFLCVASALLACLARFLPGFKNPGNQQRTLLLLFIVFAAAGFFLVSNNADGRFLYPCYCIMALFLSGWMYDWSLRLRQAGYHAAVLILIPAAVSTIGLDYVYRHLTSLRTLGESWRPVLSPEARTRYYHAHHEWFTDGQKLMENLSPDGIVLGTVYPVRVRWMDWFYGWRDLIGERMTGQTPADLARAWRELNIEIVVIPNSYPIDRDLQKAAVEQYGRLLYSEGRRDFYILDKPIPQN